MSQNCPHSRRGCWPNSAFSLSQAQVCPDFSVAVHVKMRLERFVLPLDLVCNSLDSMYRVLAAERCLF